MQISATKHSSRVSMDLTALPISWTASGPVSAAICIGGVSAGSFCEECTTAAVSTIDSDRSEPAAPAAVVTKSASEVPVLSIAVGWGESTGSVLAVTESGFGAKRCDALILDRSQIWFLNAGQIEGGKSGNSPTSENDRYARHRSQCRRLQPSHPARQPVRPHSNRCRHGDCRVRTSDRITTSQFVRA